ncbi:MAG: GNAT family N-acetyltransferase [Streptosporangiales bacterium]|nr:GNAT family N-acetyltransferase [Streptosporangiales bacterium]
MKKTASARRPQGVVRYPARLNRRASTGAIGCARVQSTARDRGYRRVMPGPVRVRTLRPDDWRTARSVRLAALTDAPLAFASSLDRERAKGEADWREMLTPERGVRALAECDGAVAGVIGVFSRGDDGEIIWMWVDPAFRGQGVGDALVAYALDWCWSRGLGCHLWVADGNDVAWRFYERLGFVATGERQPLPNDGARMESQMRYVGSQDLHP